MRNRSIEINLSIIYFPLYDEVIIYLKRLKQKLNKSKKIIVIYDFSVKILKKNNDVIFYGA